MKRWISSSLKFQGSTTLVKPRAGYLLGFVVLLASLGLAKDHPSMSSVHQVSRKVYSRTAPATHSAHSRELNPYR